MRRKMPKIYTFKSKKITPEVKRVDEIIAIFFFLDIQITSEKIIVQIMHIIKRESVVRIHHVGVLHLWKSSDYFGYKNRKTARESSREDKLLHYSLLLITFQKSPAGFSEEWIGNSEEVKIAKLLSKLGDFWRFWT